MGRDLIEAEDDVCGWTQTVPGSRAGSKAAIGKPAFDEKPDVVTSEESPGVWGAVEDAGGPA
jgi:hypothetical protein